MWLIGASEKHFLEIDCLFLKVSCLVPDPHCNASLGIAVKKRLPLLWQLADHPVNYFPYRMKGIVLTLTGTHWPHCDVVWWKSIRIMKSILHVPLNLHIHFKRGILAPFPSSCWEANKMQMSWQPAENKNLSFSVCICSHAVKYVCSIMSLSYYMSLGLSAIWNIDTMIFGIILFKKYWINTYWALS